MEIFGGQSNMTKHELHKEVGLVVLSHYLVTAVTLTITTQGGAPVEGTILLLYKHKIPNNICGDICMKGYYIACGSCIVLKEVTWLQ